ncbi:MAG: DUF2799 domain-containing protein [Rhodoferax sp.]|nr:DUF2799 domain-containing protein [Rhodoferax sp.]
MSPEECKLANWRDVGLRDGVAGYPLSRVGDRAQDCEKVGVVIDTDAYARGRDAGLKSYCRIENAIPLGLNGGTYAGVCPPANGFEFEQRFQAGRAVYDLRSDLSGLDSRIERLEQRLRATHHDEDQALKEAKNDEERKKVRKSMDDRRRDLRADLSETDRRLRRKRDELRYAESALSQFR